MQYINGFTTTLPPPNERLVETGWRSYKIRRGTTTAADTMNIHMSSLDPGVTPHSPHGHSEEELLLMLSGKAQITTQPDHLSDESKTYDLNAGSMVFYPAHYKHTITNVGDDANLYLTFKWESKTTGDANVLSRLYSFAPGQNQPENETRAIQVSQVEKYKTNHIGLLGLHTTRLKPGGGYSPHQDRYDIALVLLSGSIVCQDQVVSAPAMVYIPAGDWHGVRNTSDEDAHYLVIEFHSGPDKSLQRNTAELSRLLQSNGEGKLRRLLRFSRRKIGV